MLRQPRFTILVTFTIFLVVSSITFCSFIATGQLWFVNRATAVERIQHVFPILEASHIVAYRNQNWCRNISYSGGSFSETTHVSTCNLFDGTPLAFDSQAQADFELVQQRLAWTGVRIIFLNTEFGQNGQLTYGEFNIDCIFCQRIRYVYQPSYGSVPPDVPNEFWYTSISKDWYFVEEDWN